MVIPTEEEEFENVDEKIKEKYTKESIMDAIIWVSNITHGNYSFQFLNKSNEERLDKILIKKTKQ